MAFVNLSEINLDIDSLSKPMWSVVVDQYRYVLYSTYKVLIFKGENKEPSYEITPVGCTCPGDKYSNNACKHRKAISFLGDGSAVPPVEGTAVKAKEVGTTSHEEVRNREGFNITLDNLFE